MIPKSVEVSGHQVWLIRCMYVKYVCLLVLCHRQIVFVAISFSFHRVLGSTVLERDVYLLIQFVLQVAIHIAGRLKIQARFRVAEFFKQS